MTLKFFHLYIQLLTRYQTINLHNSSGIPCIIMFRCKLNSIYTALRRNTPDLRDTSLIAQQQMTFTV